MEAKNSLTKKDNQQKTFSAFLATDAMKKKINEMVGGEKGQQFITSIISAVSANSTLAECDNASIVSAALLGQSLNLSPSPQLGHYYLVPYNDKTKGKVAQFQIGYKGYIQLAIRSGYYKKLNVLAIKEGELIKYDPLNEEIDVKLIEDEELREQTPTIGYYAMFEYQNGFRKVIYWSKKKMENHAKQYSQGYRNDISKNTKYTFWSKDFDGMAYKTMLRQLISKWGIMSIDMQYAMESDMAQIKEDGSFDYIDNVDVDSNDLVIENDTEPVQELENETIQQEPVKEEQNEQFFDD